MCDIDMQQTRKIWTIIEEDHMMVILPSLIKIHAVVSEKKVVLAITNTKFSILP